MFERILIEEYIFCLRKLYLPSFHCIEYNLLTTVILVIVKIKVNFHDVDSWAGQVYRFDGSYKRATQKEIFFLPKIN